jgi:hypothetical protein
MPLMLWGGHLTDGVGESTDVFGIVGMCGYTSVTRGCRERAKGLGVLGRLYGCSSSGGMPLVHGWFSTAHLKLLLLLLQG